MGILREYCFFIALPVRSSVESGSIFSSNIQNRMFLTFSMFLVGCLILCIHGYNLSVGLQNSYVKQKMLLVMFYVTHFNRISNSLVYCL